MCGIAGRWTAHPNPPQATAAMGAALTALAHRGPDDRGAEVLPLAGGELALGQTRLSIIDLSSGGHQPMHTADGRFTLVFNGEIYNYKELRHELAALGAQFRTESDTEVLLAAWAHWGERCLTRLVGMFAFCVVDHQAQSLVLARDAFGIKPLFMWQGQGTLAFASEVPALRALTGLQPQVNLQTAYDYLVLGSYDAGAATFFQGIEQLLPGHWARFSMAGGRLSSQGVHRWWWPQVAQASTLSFEQAAQELRHRFLDSVRLHLRSDVPLGAALSGGVDSSAVVCAIRHIEPQADIHTFSFVAPGSPVDEEAWADRINQHVGAKVHKVRVSAQEIVADIDDMILAQGEPFGSTSIYAQYRVFKLARDAGIKVTLDGQGADELLAGYSGYPDARLRSLVAEGRPLAAMAFARQWAAWPGRGLKPAAVMTLRALLPESAVHGLKLLTRRHQRLHPAEWLVGSVLDAQGVRRLPANWVAGPDVPPGRQLAAALRHALTGPGLSPLLRHGDRNSMRWSIESRVPFLTTDLAQFCLSLPEHYLLSNGGETKHVFRAAMRGIVPNEVLDRKDKVGFATPEQAWLRALGDTPLQWLDAANDIPFLDAGKAKAAVQQALGAPSGFTFQSWRLINFCRWWHLVQPSV